MAPVVSSLGRSADLQVGNCWPEGQRYDQTRTVIGPSVPTARSGRTTLIVAVDKNSTHTDFDVDVLLALGIPEVNSGPKAASVFAVEIALDVP